MDERLQAIKALIEQKEEVDHQLEVLLGGGVVKQRRKRRTKEEIQAEEHANA